MTDRTLTGSHKNGLTYCCSTEPKTEKKWTSLQVIDWEIVHSPRSVLKLVVEVYHETVKRLGTGSSRQTTDTIKKRLSSNKDTNTVFFIC